MSKRLRTELTPCRISLQRTRKLQNMFWDYQTEHTSRSQSSCPSMSTGSFSSNADYDTAPIRTPPPSTRRSSLDSLKLEDMDFSLVHTPDGYGTSCGMCTVSSIDMGPRLTDQSLCFPAGQLVHNQALFAFSNFSKHNTEDLQSFQPSHGLPIQTPGLEMDLISPISGAESSFGSMDFVDPSQTTFINVLDAHSPMPLMRPLQFESPASGYTSMGISPMANMSFHLQYNDCKSASTTPSRAPTTPCQPSAMRQPEFEPLKSSATFQPAQAEPRTTKHTRKRLQRSLSSRTIPGNIRIQEAADKPCLFQGCDKKFKRQEHLKRHERTHNPDPDDPNSCPCCQHPFKGRSDNMTTHLRLHAKKDNAKRVPYDERAQGFLDAIARKNKKKKAKTEDVVKLEDGVKRCIPTKTRPRERVLRAAQARRFQRLSA